MIGSDITVVGKHRFRIHEEDGGQWYRPELQLHFETMIQHEDHQSPPSWQMGPTRYSSFTDCHDTVTAALQRMQDAPVLTVGKPTIIDGSAFISATQARHTQYHSK